jgi:hypothetical protein
MPTCASEASGEPSGSGSLTPTVREFPAPEAQLRPDSLRSTMSSRVAAGVSCAFLCLGCNFGKSDDQSRPLPAPEPASSIVPTRPAVAPPPTPAPRPRDPERAATKPNPTTPTAEPPTPAATATATTTSPVDAGSPGAATPSALPTSLPSFDAGAISATCLPKCQASLSACISKPVPLDAGFPSLESMAECKKLFEDCRSACQ